jgi:outer membrane biosynthesis protein TonB
MTERQDARYLLERAERAATAGDLVSADELLRSAARIQEQELGPQHPDLANTLNNLAIVAERTGNSSDAETFYRRAAAIAAAALPSDHPMTVASRQNLEEFCRARGLSIDAPALTTTPPDTQRELSAFPSEKTEAEQIPVRPDNTDVTAKSPKPPSAPPRPNPGRPARTTLDSTAGNASHLLRWVGIGAVVLLAAVLLLWRPWSSRDAASTAPAPEPATAQPAEGVPPQVAAPATAPAPIEQAAPPASAPAREDRNAPTNKASAAGGVSVANAQVCRTFSTSGGNWRCDPVGDAAPPGPMVFYTRVRSPRDTAVVHRWYRGSTLRQSVTLAIQANAKEGYRTYSRMTVNGGDWRLEVRSADGNLLHEQRVAVQ